MDPPLRSMVSPMANVLAPPMALYRPTVDPLWTLHGPGKDLPWTRRSMDPPGTRNRLAMDTPWRPPWHTMALFMALYGSAINPPWTHHRPCMDPPWRRTRRSTNTPWHPPWRTTGFPRICSTRHGVFIEYPWWVHGTPRRTPSTRHGVGRAIEGSMDISPWRSMGPPWCPPWRAIASPQTLHGPPITLHDALHATPSRGELRSMGPPWTCMDPPWTPHGPSVHRP